jgi:preprotein translocase subunit SecD
MNSSSKRWNSNVLLSGFTFWLAVAAMSVYLLYPLRQKLKFGIDLVGGTYITLKVEVNKAIEHDLRNQSKNLLLILKKEHDLVPVSHKVEDCKIHLVFQNSQDTNLAIRVLRENAADLKLTQEGQNVYLAMHAEASSRLEHWALESNIEVLRTRLNKLGVEEIKITAQGDSGIVVELPDVDDPTRAKEMIGTPAMLEFKVVEARGSSHQNILEEFGGNLPEGMIIIPNRDVRGRKEFLLVPEVAEVTGRYLIDAMPSSDDVNRKLGVSFRFNPEGGEKFYELTSENQNRELAAILDGQAVSVATIKEPIHDNVQISGSGFTIEQVKELATLLKSGAFVAPVSFSEERRVGPSLGADSIQSGLVSCLIGLGLLLLFSIYYYKICGIFAFLALLFNLLLVLLALSLTGAALTLPGIAGMVLTVGMAIDSSVLIYERIKELLAEGKNASQAVSEGFSNALTVILDGNITTFIVGVVLFKFGTGPIQGFAVTMMIGIVATLITGLFFLRSLIDFVLSRQKVQKLSI